jgi:hypothetical protein
MKSETAQVHSSKTGIKSDLLGIICGFTFLLCGMSILDHIRWYSMADMAAAYWLKEGTLKTPAPGSSRFVISKNIMGGMFLTISADNIRKFSTLGLISSILSLSGAILMYRLRRIGFYIFITGVLMSMITPIAVLIANSDALIPRGGITALIGLILVILYSSCLKILIK